MQRNKIDCLQFDFVVNNFLIHCFQRFIRNQGVINDIILWIEEMLVNDNSMIEICNGKRWKAASACFKSAKCFWGRAFGWSLFPKMTIRLGWQHLQHLTNVDWDVVNDSVWEHEGMFRIRSCKNMHNLLSWMIAHDILDSFVVSTIYKMKFALGARVKAKSTSWRLAQVSIIANCWPSWSFLLTDADLFKSFSGSLDDKSILPSSESGMLDTFSSISCIEKEIVEGGNGRGKADAAKSLFSAFKQSYCSMILFQFFKIWMRDVFPVPCAPSINLSSEKSRQNKLD